MQIVESTKPYLYYEQIINGLVSIPKRFQTYLGNAILVKNEQHRIELEKQKVAERLTLEEEQGQPDTSKGLFRLPLFGWFSSDNKTEEGNGTASHNNVNAVSKEVSPSIVKDDDGDDVLNKGSPSIVKDDDGDDVLNKGSPSIVKDDGDDVLNKGSPSIVKDDGDVVLNMVSQNNVIDKVEKTPLDEVVSTVEAPTILAKSSDPCNIRKWRLQEE